MEKKIPQRKAIGVEVLSMNDKKVMDGKPSKRRPFIFIVLLLIKKKNKEVKVTKETRSQEKERKKRILLLR